MGLPKQLTERQIKFAELLVYNEGRKSAAEAAYEAGYKTRPRQAACDQLTTIRGQRQASSVKRCVKQQALNVLPIIVCEGRCFPVIHQ